MINFIVDIDSYFEKLKMTIDNVDRNEIRAFREALQKPLFPSRIEQNCSVRFFFTTSKNGIFLPLK